MWSVCHHQTEDSSEQWLSSPSPLLSPLSEEEGALKGQKADWYYDKMINCLFRGQKKEKLCFVFVSMNTCNHWESQLMFVVIKPARYIYPTAINTRVTLLDLPDGQRHVPFPKITHKQVALWQPADHWCPIGFDHLVGAATVWYGPSAPAHRQPAVLFGIIVAS